MKKIVTDFVPQGGRHCITNSLKQILAYEGIEISEAMLFGMGAGLSFLYLNQATAPMLNGRIKVFEFECKLAERLNIDIKCKQGTDYEKIWQKNKKTLDEDTPILIYVDMPYLSYLGLDPNSHFGGHAVVLFGYDEEQKEYYISDRDNSDFAIRTPFGEISEDHHIVKYSELQKARSSKHRPFPAKNKYLEISVLGYKAPGRETIQSAIAEVVDGMLYPPAKLLGLSGIDKCSKEIKKWEKFTDDKLTRAAITNYFQISKDGGTGGGIFRKMYGEFLIEAAAIVDSTEMENIGHEYIMLGERWDEVAETMWQLSQKRNRELLKDISDMVGENYGIEKDLLMRLEKENKKSVDI